MRFFSSVCIALSMVTQRVTQKVTYIFSNGDIRACFSRKGSLLQN